MILIKAHDVRLATVQDVEVFRQEVAERGEYHPKKNPNGAELHYSVSPPPSHALIHDTEGRHLPRCFLYVGPYQRSVEPIEMDKAGRAYFGKGYRATQATVNVPDGPWRPEGAVMAILYKRDRGRFAAAQSYLHHFSNAVPLSRCGRFYCLELTDDDSCRIGWEGIVRP